MSKILKWYNQLWDKAKHFILADLIAFATLPFMFISLWAIPINLVFASVLFFGKEISDKKTSSFDWWDLVADYLGWWSGISKSFTIYTLLKL